VRFKPPLRVKQVGRTNVWRVSCPAFEQEWWGTGRRKMESLINSIGWLATGDATLTLEHWHVMTDGFYQNPTPWLKREAERSLVSTLRTERGRNEQFTPLEKRRAYLGLQKQIAREHWPFLSPLAHAVFEPQQFKHPRMGALKESC
jgi:hypothetical protein